MAKRFSYIAIEAVLVTILVFLPIVRSANDELVPSDKAQLDSWFDRNVGGITSRKTTLDRALAAAQDNPKVIKVRADGSGDFKTITDALNSIPENNKNRMILSIGQGNYTERIKIERSKPFVTLYGDPSNMPTLVYDGTALKYGTMESSTLNIESDYFSAVNLRVVNSAPRPDGKREGAQAVAMRIDADWASFYNCKFYGFQDTVCDNRGKHLFKDCYVEGTVDFIFGSGQSLYLNSEIHVIPGDDMAMITAHARTSSTEKNGYIFVHCTVTGTGGVAFLGRAWFPYARVVFAYSELSDAVHPEGWSNNFSPETNSTVYFGEYNNKGAGAALEKRVSFGKKMSDAEVKPFINLGYIEASKWLLPPTKI